jgi:hypothetical protein
MGAICSLVSGVALIAVIKAWASATLTIGEADSRCIVISASFCYAKMNKNPTDNGISSRYLWGRTSYTAAFLLAAKSWSAKYQTASIAALQPSPAAVMAWR